MGQRDAPTSDRIAEIERRVARVDVHVFLSSVRRGRPTSRVCDQDSTEVEAKAQVSSSEMTSATKSGAPGQYRSVRSTDSARSEATNAALGARTVSGSRSSRKPVSAANVIPASVLCV